MTTEMDTRMKVLCVDDEPNILEGLTLHLRRRYDVLSAPGGAAALAILEADPSIAVILSDMRMPGMDGATFLGRARQLVPDATRILLTGQTELGMAIEAVNTGQLFRFLTKPCSPVTLLAAVEAGAAHHRLLNSERVLLEETLQGCVKTLTELCALTNPLSFGRASRLKGLVSELAVKLNLRERWPVEVAAMLSQLGAMTLPVEMAEKFYYGTPLTAEEQKVIERLPQVTERLLGHIPRMEHVRSILSTYMRPYRRGEVVCLNPAPEAVTRGAHMLKAALDFDVLESSGLSEVVAINTMRSRADQYEPEVLEALASIRRRQDTQSRVCELPLDALREGMVLVEDVRLASGNLFVARGYQVKVGFVERARNFRPGTVREPIRVLVPAGMEVPANLLAPPSGLRR